MEITDNLQTFVVFSKVTNLETSPIEIKADFVKEDSNGNYEFIALNGEAKLKVAKFSNDYNWALKAALERY